MGLVWRVGFLLENCLDLVRLGWHRSATMHRPAFVAFLAAVLTLAGAAAGAQTGWQETSNPTGRLAVAMPCSGTWTSQVTDDVNSGPYTSNLLVCRANDEVYLVGWVDYQPSYRPDIQAELKANQDNFIKGIDAVLLTSNPITSMGYMGLEFTGNMRGMNLATSRVLMDGYRPYMLAVLTPIGQDRSENIRRFLTSFRITPRP